MDTLPESQIFLESGKMISGTGNALDSTGEHADALIEQSDGGFYEVRAGYPGQGP
jgi:hypothetical protein